MNTHHQIVEEQVICTQINSNNSSPELMGIVDADSFKRNYQVEQMYNTVAPSSHYQIIPTSLGRNDVYQTQQSLSNYSGPAYLLTTAADGTQHLQPLQEHNTGADIPQIHIESVPQVEEVLEPVVENCVSVPSAVAVPKTVFTHVSKKNRPYKCEQCTASFLDLSELDEHKSKHTDDGPFTCLDCHFTFMFKSHYRSHRTRCEKKRGEMATIPKPFVVEGHSHKHKFPKNPIKKEPLQQEMVYVDSINATMLKGSNAAAKQSASMRFNPSNPTFKRTKRTGRTDRPYECDECDATFKVECDLKTHKMKHTGEGPFKCEECEFVFLFRKLYESHQRRCTKKRAASGVGVLPLGPKREDPSLTLSSPIGGTGLEPIPVESCLQVDDVSLPCSSGSYQSPVYSQPTIIEMRAAQPSEVLQVQHSVFDSHPVTSVLRSTHNRQDAKYELVPSVELDGMSMNQIVNLIKDKAPSQ